MIGASLLILLLLSVSLSSEEKYCIQAAAYRSLKPAMMGFEKIKDLPRARIELRGNVYLLRVGLEERPKDLTLTLRKIRRSFPDAFVKKCGTDPSYVVHPKPSGEGGLKVKVKSDKSRLDESLEELRKEVKNLRKDLTLLKNEIGHTYSIDKFLFSMGVFLGGLFLFTWFLIILLYIRMGNVNLIKVINLLSEGHAVKVEKGKLLVYDKENGEWREVE